MNQKLIWLALAGALGALARYGLGGVVHRAMGENFPWGTAVCNILGCLLFGIIWSLATERDMISPELRTIILVGFMGAFTTFSSFIYETGKLITDSQLLLAFANVASQMILGLAVFFLGLALGRAF